MNDFNMIVALIGGIVLALGLVSRRLSTGPFPPSLLALLIGVAIGPHLLGLVDVDALGERTSILEKAARLALGIGLVGVALRIPRQFPRHHWREMLVLVGLAMPLMWVISTGLIYLILGLPFWLAALVGAIVTPTDPVAASPIVTGSLAEENIPEDIRHAVSFESGANDGLSYLFVFMSFLLLTRPAGEAISHWLTHTLLWEIGVATICGLMLGYAAAKLLTVAEKRSAINSDWRLVYTVALALLAVGLGRLIASDEVLLVFAAGSAFTQVISAEERENEEHGQEAVNRFFAIPIFVLLGAAIPWAGWQELGWTGLALAVAILLLRRPPVLLAMRPLLSRVRTVPDALFVGWFGPIAVAAIYYASMMEHRLGEPLVWDLVSLIICASVIAHGMSSSALTRIYGRINGQAGNEDPGFKAGGSGR